MGSYGLTIQDYSKENSVMRVNCGPINAATIVAVEASALAFRTALAGISGGTFTAERLMAYDNKLAGEPPTDPSFQRELKWLVIYEDTTSHELYKALVPCPVLTLLGDHTDEINYSDSQVTAFIVAFEEFVKSPTGGSSNVLTIKLVGRNL